MFLVGDFNSEMNDKYTNCSCESYNLASLISESTCINLGGFMRESTCCNLGDPIKEKTCNKNLKSPSCIDLF